MSILQRIGDILEANLNSLIDKAENPEKMIDQYLRQAVEDLDEVKKETAGVMAEESRTRRVYDENIAEIEKFTDLAKKALTAGNEGDARVFLGKKQELEKTGQTIKLAYETAKSNATKMRQLHDKLVDDINTLHARRDELKSKLSIAEAQQKVNELGNSAASAQSTLGDFDRLEDKINRIVDTASAEAVLSEVPNDEAAELEEKYSSESGSVDSELEALKKSMGLE